MKLNTTELSSEEISSTAVTILTLIINDISIPLIAVFGIMANIINVIVYIRLGVNDSSNLSFLMLTIADMFNLVTSVLLTVFYNQLLNSSVDLNFDPMAVGYVAATWPRGLFSKTACTFTVFITLERCLCIVSPLKVKAILTTSRTLMILIALFMASIAVHYIHFFTATFYLTYYFDPKRNKTILGLGVGENYDQVNMTAGYINATTFFILFTLMISSTALLVYKLQQTAKWRKQSLAPLNKKQDAVSKRDQSVSVTVAVLSSVLIFTYTFYTINCVLGSIVNDLVLDWKNSDLQQAVWAVSLFLENINSSVSAVIYFNMSSQYRKVFITLLGRSRMIASILNYPK